MLRNTRSFSQIACALIALIVLNACPAAARDILVSTQAEYKDAVKAANPGDTIVLANGEWRDFEILFTGEGTEDDADHADRRDERATCLSRASRTCDWPENTSSYPGSSSGTAIRRPIP